MLRLLMIVAVALLSTTGWAAEKKPATAEDVAAASRKAIEFLKKQQTADGNFGKATYTGVVALVLKGFATGPDKLREADPAVAKAVEYIKKNQQSNGAITLPKDGLENYNTSMSIVGLAVLENPAHKDVIEKAKSFVLTCQNVEERGYNPDEHARAFGGFNYGTSGGQRADMSNTSFSLEGLKAAGLEEGSPAWKNAQRFIKRCQDNAETNDFDKMKDGDSGGGFVYLPGTSEFGEVKSRSGKMTPKPYGNMTYQGVKCLIFAKVSKDDPALQAAYKWISANYAADKNPGGNGSQGYFYYANSFAKAFTAMGVKEVELADGSKANWAKDLASHLISLQAEDGSFVNTEKRWMEGDTVLATAYTLDALNLCYAALK